MKVINLSETDTILNQFVAELRDVRIQGDRMRFRRNIERIGELMAYEMSRTLCYSAKNIETPLGTAEARTPDDELVVATVFRAGLPLHQGFLNVFDRAGNAFVSAYRFYKDEAHREVDVHVEYIATPDLSRKTVLLVDPMLATGESLEMAWKAFLMGSLSGIVEPIFGILVVLAAGGIEPVMPWLLSFAAGAMMYVVVEELIPEAHLGEHSNTGTLGVMAGFLIMMILDVALG